MNLTNKYVAMLENMARLALRHLALKDDEANMRTLQIEGCDTM